MLDLARVKAITLDLDDTLWPVWPTIRRAEVELTQWLVEHAPAAALAAQDPELKLRLRDEVNRRHGARAHDLSFLRLESIRDLLAHAGEPGHLAEPAFEVFFAARQRVDLYEDALDALHFWSSRYPVVAVSNGNADVHRVGIGAHFHASVSALTAGVAKPDVRIFDAAAQAAGVAAHEVLHIGDDVHADALGALDAGMQTVWLNREGQAWPVTDRSAPMTVRSLRDLCALWPADR